MKDSQFTVFKEYVWEKSWVRPYESPFGLFLNFCKVNVFTFSQACRTLKISRTMSDRGKPFFSRDIGINVGFVGATGLSVFREVLGMGETPFFTDSALNEDAYNSLVDPSFRYCPDCIKAGYHSYFHQISGCSRCFIHNADLIKTGIKYELCMNPDNKSQLGLPGSFTDNIPLPCEREEFRIDKIDNVFPCPVKKVFISDTENSLEPQALGALLIDKDCALKPVIKIKDIKRETRLFDAALEAMVEAFFNVDNPLHLMDYDSKLKEFKDYHFRYFKPVEAFLYYKALLMDKKYHILNNNGSVPYYPGRNEFPKKDLRLLAAYFMRLITGSSDLDSAFSVKWVTSPFSTQYNADNHLYIFHLWNFAKINQFNEYKVDNMEDWDYPETYSCRRNFRHLYAMRLAIINDAADFIWNQCLEMAEHREEINIREIWDELFVPNYMTVWMQNDEVWIYRIPCIYMKNRE